MHACKKKKKIFRNQILPITNKVLWVLNIEKLIHIFAASLSNTQIRCNHGMHADRNTLMIRNQIIG